MSSRDTSKSTDAASTLVEVGGRAFVIAIRTDVAGKSEKMRSTIRLASVSRSRQLPDVPSSTIADAIRS